MTTTSLYWCTSTICVGPVLFLLFINDIVLFTNYALTLFGNDTSVFVSVKRIEELKNKFQRLVHELDNCFNLNKLFLNPTKTNFIIFYNRIQHNFSEKLDDMELK